MRSVVPMKTAKIGYLVISVLFCVLGIGLIAAPGTSVVWLGRLLGIGMIVFGAYDADYGMAAPVYSLVYNGIYLSVEAVLTLIILYLPPVKKVMGQLNTMATQRLNARSASISDF